MQEKPNIKTVFKLTLFLVAAAALIMPVCATEKPLEPITELNAKIEYNKVYAENLGEMTLDLNDSQKLKLREGAPDASIDGTIKLTEEEEELKKALEIQKGKDIEDIKKLWEATLERNAIIRFALEKISAPPQERPVRSSLMARSVATMLQGASIVPSLFGMGMATEYGGAFGGQLLANAFSKKFLPPPGMPTITEPELIQLTALIEDLQEQIINSYYNYKSSLESLMLEKKNKALQERNYQKAIDSQDMTSIIIASALFDKAKQSELRLKQQVKLHRVQLERLAGIDTVSGLNLTLSESVMQAKYKFDQLKNDKLNLNTPLQDPVSPSGISTDSQNTFQGSFDTGITPGLMKEDKRFNEPIMNDTSTVNPELQEEHIDENQ